MENESLVKNAEDNKETIEVKTELSRAAIVAQVTSMLEPRIKALEDRVNIQSEIIKDQDAEIARLNSFTKDIHKIAQYHSHKEK